MNKEKTKKLAFAAVAVVMAGSMMFSLAACTPTDNGDNGNNGNNEYGPDLVPVTPGEGVYGGGSVDTSGLEEYTLDTSHLNAGLVPNFDENGKLSYTAGTGIVVNMGNQNKDNPQSITYNSNSIIGTITLPDGKEYEAGDLKPAWAAAQEELNVKFTNQFQNLSSNEQLTTPIQGNTLGNYNLVSASSAVMTQNTQYLLNLSDYLDYMPNYKAFLDANPAIAFSLTSDPATGAMYYAPYFDGMNDIEKYTLAEQTWISAILNATDAELEAETTTFAAQGTAKGLTTTSASATSYMGQTGSYTVDTTALTGSSIVDGVVNYDAALAAAQSASAELGQAISAAKGSAYTGTSGNIVDIMNDVINSTNGAVTGGQLIKILQEYIDVTYTVGDTAYTDRADVFNSISALWDVDLLVAISRCAVTSPSILGATSDQLVNIYGIAGRQATTQRRQDLVAFAGELYGVRGMESRIEYTYIDVQGNLRDARQNADSYNLVANLGNLSAEGLIYRGTANVNSARDFTGPSPLFMHDYSQTQTTTGFKDDEYNVSPILTPVSKWDMGENGEHETVMRFTESWRSVKNSGFCVPIESVRNKPEVLSATLAFIDYLFSNDGQLVMTYGPQSTNGDTNPNGWWYADEATGVELEDVAEQTTAVSSDGEHYVQAEQWQIKSEYEGQYFVFNNTVYEGMVDYSRAIPSITTDNETLFSGGTVNGVKLNDNTTNTLPAAAYNYTNYARHLLGTTLPLGNKDQGFEYQCTSPCALAGAAVVSQAVANGTIQHVKMTLDEGDTLWYLIAPTSFALDNDQQSIINGAEQTDISGAYFYNSSSNNYVTNIYIDLVFYGFDTSKDICGSATLGKIRENGAAFVSFLNGEGLATRINTYSDAWQQTAIYFQIW